jgi:hypothetical protein
MNTKYYECLGLGRIRGLLEQANAQGEILLVVANKSDYNAWHSSLPKSLYHLWENANSCLQLSTGLVDRHEVRRQLDIFANSLL